MSTLTKAQITAYQQEGVTAFHAGHDVTVCPYQHTSSAHSEWIHGWWGCYYRRQAEDTKKIARWLFENVPCVYSMKIAEAIAEALTSTEAYQHDRPIANNRLGSYMFTVPAPSTLRGEASDA